MIIYLQTILFQWSYPYVKDLISNWYDSLPFSGIWTWDQGLAYPAVMIYIVHRLRFWNLFFSSGIWTWDERLACPAMMFYIVFWFWDLFLCIRNWWKYPQNNLICSYLLWFITSSFIVGLMSCFLQAYKSYSCCLYHSERQFVSISYIVGISVALPTYQENFACMKFE